jgi:hypothetical protein
MAGVKRHQDGSIEEKLGAAAFNTSAVGSNAG